MGVARSASGTGGEGENVRIESGKRLGEKVARSVQGPEFASFVAGAGRRARRVPVRLSAAVVHGKQGPRQVGQVEFALHCHIECVMPELVVWHGSAIRRQRPDARESENRVSVIYSNQSQRSFGMCPTTRTRITIPMVSPAANLAPAADLSRRTAPSRHDFCHRTSPLATSSASSSELSPVTTSAPLDAQQPITAQSAARLPSSAPCGRRRIVAQPLRAFDRYHSRTHSALDLQIHALDVSRVDKFFRDSEQAWREPALNLRQLPSVLCRDEFSVDEVDFRNERMATHPESDESGAGNGAERPEMENTGCRSLCGDSLVVSHTPSTSEAVIDTMNDYQC